MLFSPFKAMIPSAAPQMDAAPNPLSSHDAIVGSMMKIGGGGGEGGDDDENVSIKDSAGLKSGNYSRDRIANLFKASQALGVDPYEALGIALQEGAFGAGESKTTEKTRSRRNRAGLGNVTSALDENDLQLVNDYASKGLDMDSVKLALALKKKKEYAKHLGFTDPAAMLQAYNGYGTLTSNMLGGAKKAYGVEIGNGIDLKKNPLYGKRILQLKKDLMSNKDLQALLK